MADSMEQIYKNWLDKRFLLQTFEVDGKEVTIAEDDIRAIT
jgi:hypothetical protein